MNESDMTRQLMQEYKAYGDMVVFKHGDMFTSGLPDMSVNWIFTTWLELKVAHGNEKELFRLVKQKRLQLEIACDLEKVGTRVFYVCWLFSVSDVLDIRLQIWRPTDLKEHVYHPERAKTKPFAEFKGKSLDKVIALSRGEIA